MEQARKDRLKFSALVAVAVVAVFVIGYRVAVLSTVPTGPAVMLARQVDAAARSCDAVSVTVTPGAPVAERYAVYGSTCRRSDSRHGMSAAPTLAGQIAAAARSCRTVEVDAKTPAQVAAGADRFEVIGQDCIR